MLTLHESRVVVQNMSKFSANGICFFSSTFIFIQSIIFILCIHGYSVYIMGYNPKSLYLLGCSPYSSVGQGELFYWLLCSFAVTSLSWLFIFLLLNTSLLLALHVPGSYYIYCTSLKSAISPSSLNSVFFILQYIFKIYPILIPGDPIYLFLLVRSSPFYKYVICHVFFCLKIFRLSRNNTAATILENKISSGCESFSKLEI